MEPSMKWFKKKQKETFEEALSKTPVPGKLPLPEKLSEEPVSKIHPPVKPLYFACIHCSWYFKDCGGTYSDFCDNYVKYVRNTDNGRQRVLSCPHCNSTHVEGTFGDRFHCLNCGSIFS